MTLDFPDTSSSKSTSTQTAHQISGSDLSVSDIESSISFQCTEVGAEKIEFSNSPQNASSETSFRTSSILKWWLPEIVASTLSVATLFSLALILRLYEKRNITDLRLLSSLTLNGLIAVISTLNRVLLMVPVGSILSQEGWHWFAEKDQRKRCKSSLGDLDALDQAARGAWGSLIFLFCSRLSWDSVAAAVISVLSLGFGVFIQQLVSLKVMVIESPNSSKGPENVPHMSMTNFVRSTNPSELTECNWKTFQRGIKVHWGWFIPPVTIVISSVALLGIMIARTARSKVRVWKGNPLILLLFKVDDEIRQDGMRHIQSYMGVEKAIGNRKAVLHENSDGCWMFRDPEA